MKKNAVIVSLIVILVLIVSGISVYATATYYASQVYYTKNNGTTITVSEALNYLYNRNIYNNYLDINMTSNESDILTVTSSSYWENDSSYGYKAFDKSVETYENTWVSSSNSKPQWIDLSFNESKTIYAFSFYPECNNFNARLPKDIVVYTSEDGTNWNSVYEGQLDGKSYRWHYLILDNASTSKFWRLKFNSTWENNGHTAIAEIRIHVL